jgi:segregation and condensation protein B
MKLKSQIEAILFLTDKPIRAAAIARIVNQDVQEVRQALLELIHDYEERGGGLEIADEDGYVIQVRDEYASIIDEFVPMDMPVALLRTLSAIAIKQPVMQSEIIKIRGAGAYDHIKELSERELIIKREEGGRSPQLSTTKKFQEYFRLSQDAKSLRKGLFKQDHPDSPESQPGDQMISNNEQEPSHESKQQLEMLYATSPDSSLVFNPDKDNNQSGDDLTLKEIVATPVQLADEIDE